MELHVWITIKVLDILEFLIDNVKATWKWKTASTILSNDRPVKKVAATVLRTSLVSKAHAIYYRDTDDLLSSLIRFFEEMNLGRLPGKSSTDIGISLAQCNGWLLNKRLLIANRLQGPSERYYIR